MTQEIHVVVAEIRNKNPVAAAEAGMAVAKVVVDEEVLKILFVLSFYKCKN